MAWKGFAQRDDEQMAAFRQFLQIKATACSGRQPLMRYMPRSERGRNALGLACMARDVSELDSPEVRQFCEEHRDDVDFYSGCSGWLTASLPPAGR